MLGLAIFFWMTAAAALVLGMRTRVKPILIVGLVNGALALAITQGWLRRGMRRR